MARFSRGRIEMLLAGARQFAVLQPAMMGLVRRATEPALEQLRRGVFALASSILERIADFDADSHQAIADEIAPSILRPLAAATIMELSPHATARLRVAAGAEVTPPGHPDCRFRLVSAVDLGPYAVENVRAGTSTLHFDLRARGQVLLEDAIGDDLRLYVEGPPERALLLLMHVLGHTERVELRGPDQRVRRAGSVSGYGTHASETLAPEPDGPPNASAVLKEYFVFREKFQFIVLHGIQSALRGSRANSAAVTLRFDAPLPPGASVGPDGLRPHCAPAVNLFTTSAEPQTFGPGTSSFVVRPAGLPRARGGVYAVVSATATARDREGPEIPLPAVRRFAADRFSPDFPYAVSTRLVPAREDEEPQTALVLTNPRGAEPLLEPHVISLELLATNRACDFAPGELSAPGAGMPAGIHVRNLLRTSRYLPPCTGPELALRTFMRAALPHGDPLFALQSLLFSLMPQDRDDPARFQANRARVDAIESFTITPTVDESGSRRGYLASFIIDDMAFHGLGDAALFLRLLHHVLDVHVSTNSFFRCEAICKKTGEKIHWPPRAQKPAPHVHPCTLIAAGKARAPLRAPKEAFRRSEVAILAQLAESAPRYGFFEATRLLEHALGFGDTNGTRRPVRFGQWPSLAFPTGDVAGLTIAGEKGRKEARLALRFLGLVGTASPLATQWTEELIQWDDEGALRGFYDVLHDALAIRLYRAWKTRAIEGGFDLEGRDPLSQALRSLAGTDPLANIADDPLPPMMALGLADFQRGQPHAIDVRSAEQLLQRLLPWPISLEPNVHRTVAVSPAERAHIGGRRSILGRDFVYGEERDDSEGLLCLHVGPVDRATYETLMPGGTAYTDLERLTRRIFDAKLEVLLEVHLETGDIPKWKLGAGRIGVDTRYTTQSGETVHVRVPLLSNAEEARPEFVPFTTHGQESC